MIQLLRGGLRPGATERRKPSRTSGPTKTKVQHLSLKNKRLKKKKEMYQFLHFAEAPLMDKCSLSDMFVLSFPVFSALAKNFVKIFLKYFWGIGKS